MPEESIMTCQRAKVSAYLISTNGDANVWNRGYGGATVCASHILRKFSTTHLPFAYLGIASAAWTAKKGGRERIAKPHSAFGSRNPILLRTFRSILVRGSSQPGSYFIFSIIVGNLLPVHYSHIYIAEDGGTIHCPFP